MRRMGSGVLRIGLFLKFLFLVLAFSIDGLACEDVNFTTTSEQQAAYIAADPNDPARYYTAGRVTYCQGSDRHAEGLGYIAKASDMDHVTASYFLGDYHRKDGDLNSKVSLPTTQENYDASIFYYERAATLIENTSHYPNGAHNGVSEVEGETYMSVRAFIHLTGLYFNGYSRAIGDMLKNNVSYTDTIQVLENMKSAAGRCLKRPSLAVWGARQDEIARSKQVICQAERDFTEKALDLEFRRIEIAKHCDAALSECAEHQAIFNQIVQAVQEMNNKTSSVPKI